MSMLHSSTADVIADVIDPEPASGRDADAETNPERRRSPRQQRTTSAWISASSGSQKGNGFYVLIRDLSLHGTGFVSDRELRKNDTHWLIIADQSLRLSTRLRVVNQTPRNDGKWNVGGEFF
jgi:hypothetical protein